MRHILTSYEQLLQRIDATNPRLSIVAHDDIFLTYAHPAAVRAAAHAFGGKRRLGLEGEGCDWVVEHPQWGRIRLAVHRSQPRHRADGPVPLVRPIPTVRMRALRRAA